jgi:CRISPR-associated protein Csx16
MGANLDYPPMTTYLITRHPGAIEWAERQGVRVDKLIVHLDPELIQAGDVVIGTLPVQLAAAVCARGGRFLNLTLDVPPQFRGRELSADDLEAFGAHLVAFEVRAVASGGKV